MYTMSSTSANAGSIEKPTAEFVDDTDICDNTALDLSPLRKNAMLLVICTAQFLDVFGANSVIVSLPAIGADLGFSAGNLQWMLSAYSLSFASAMMVSGTVSDIFHPKPVFCIGFAIIGLFSIPVAASTHPVMSIVFRSIQGLGAAMNIPSAVSMLRSTFPEPVEQGRAYGAFTMVSTIGNVMGFIIGGLLTASTSWRWVFYTMAIMTIPTSVLSWFIIPTGPPRKLQSRRLDILGISTITAGLGLFVYALAAGSDLGWKSPRVITTLSLSVALCAAFFLIERVIQDPAVAPRTWSNKNFLPLFILTMSPGWWVLGCELQLIAVFMGLWHESALKAAVRCLPMGITGLSAYFIGALVTKVHHSVFLIGGQVLMAAGSVLFALTDKPTKYWSYAVPGMIIGMMGLAAARVPCTTLMMRGARKGDEGIVAALSFTASQLGCTIGVAVVAAITIAVNAKQPQDTASQHLGYEASFWSLVALPLLMALVALFVRQ